MITVTQIIEELNQIIVDLKYHVDKNNIHLFGHDETGFDINIYFDPRESVIYFGNGGHHMHFENIDENYEEFILGIVSTLAGNTRIIEYHWNNKPQKFKLEDKNENGDWEIVSTMAFPNWMFWRKKTDIKEVAKVNYYQIRTNNTNMP